MIRTRVGYAGGSSRNPTYHNLGTHSETVQMDFDPSQISYIELLNAFWKGHDTGAPPRTRQYMSIIFYHDERQKELALYTKSLEENKGKRQVLTEILAAPTFYLAEAYHQKYYLRGVPELENEYRKIYPDDGDFVNSTATARVNGYIAGYGTRQRLDTERASLGLSDKGQAVLTEMFLIRHRLMVKP